MSRSGIFVGLFLIVGSFILFGLGAQEGAKPANMNVYDHYTDIPKILHKGLSSRNASREGYMYQHLTFIRRESHNHSYLSEDDLEIIESEEIFRLQGHQLKTLISYDQSFDGRFSPDEIKAGVLKQYPNLKQKSIQNNIDKYLRLDRDQDGVITYQEMIVLSPFTMKGIHSKKSKPYRERLALDPNTDGRLTVGELEALADRAFDTVDHNHDGILAAEEIMSFEEAISRKEH